MEIYTAETLKEEEKFWLKDFPDLQKKRRNKLVAEKEFTQLMKEIKTDHEHELFRIKERYQENMKKLTPN